MFVLERGRVRSLRDAGTAASGSSPAPWSIRGCGQRDRRHSRGFREARVSRSAGFATRGFRAGFARRAASRSVSGSGSIGAERVERVDTPGSVAVV